MVTAMVRYQLSGALRVLLLKPSPYFCIPVFTNSRFQLPGTTLSPGLLAKVTLSKGSISPRLEWPVVASMSASLMASCALILMS